MEWGFMKNVLNLVFLSLAGCLVSFSVSAASPDSNTDTRYDHFFTVDETSGVIHTQNEAPFLDPVQATQEILAQHFDSLEELKATIISLLSFELHNQTYGDVNEPYKRDKHYGSWIRDSNSGSCYNTRGKVLARDSKVPVSSSGSACTVSNGQWSDPYAGGQYTSAADIEIDHFVPLKNSYVSGAYQWDYQKRCLYANYMGNNFHLLAVYKSENRSKSDRGPDGYMPKNRAYRCQYLAQWLKVKLIWDLGLTPPEKDSVMSFVKAENCALQDFTFTAQDLENQRSFIANNMNLCH
jgi:hypothetical protein